jgi:hypothetical protein
MQGTTPGTCSPEAVKDLNQAAPQQATPYWGDKIAVWVWAISFLAMALLIAGEIVFRLIAYCVRAWSAG